MNNNSNLSKADLKDGVIALIDDIVIRYNKVSEQIYIQQGKDGNSGEIYACSDMIALRDELDYLLLRVGRWIPHCKVVKDFQRASNGLVYQTVRIYYDESWGLR